MTKLEIDTDTGIIKEKDTSKLEPIFFVIIVILGIFGAIREKISEAPKREANDVKTYCSAQQLPKTGYKACDDAKATLLNRYNRELRDAKKYLQAKQNATATLMYEQEQQCRAEKIKQYGQNICNKAVQNVKNNEQAIKNTNKEISDYEQKIQDLYNLKIDGTHIVSTNVLNLRSCPGTECNIIGKLKYGDVVFMQEDLGEWLKISVKNKSGYAVKKFLWDSRRVSDSNSDL